MAKVELVCLWCNKPFLRERKEYNRRIRQGHTRFFCSLEHGSLWSNKENPRPVRREYPDHFKKANEWRKYKTDPFKEYARRARYRQHQVDVDSKYLAEVWEKQLGRCAITGIPLTHIKDTDDLTIMASLDRIDSNRGYVRGNVQFVSARVNYAKSNSSDEQVRKFFALVRENLSMTTSLMPTKTDEDEECDPPPAPPTYGAA